MNIRDLDIVFISYDEPKADELFENLKARSPRIPFRVHGIKGFDAAHKAAARMTSTNRFVTVDGDSVVRDEFFETILDDDTWQTRDHVHSFTALNSINGLAYGNGGVKIWPRNLVLNVDTHEKIGGNDFCWTYRYMQQNMIASDVIFQSAYQAWRAGYREAVKLSLVKNEKLDWETTLKEIYPPNLSRLLIWASVGDDASYGEWAIYGARCGLEHVWISDLDCSLINDYDWFKEKWETIHTHIQNNFAGYPAALSRLLATRLEVRLDIEIPDLTPEQSKWAKRIYENPTRQGLMIPDMKAPI